MSGVWTALFVVAVCVAGVWALHRFVPPMDLWEPWPAEDEAVDADFAARLDAYIAERELE